MSQERTHHVDMSVKRGNMQARVPLSVVLELCVHVDASIEEKVDHIRVAVRARQREGVHHLRSRCFRVQIAILGEAVFHDVDPSNTSRAWKIQRCAAAREVFRRLWLAICQAGANQRLLVAAGSRTIHACAVFEQHVDHLPLHAGNGGRSTRGDEAESRTSTSVDVRFAVDVGARREQDLR